MIEAGDRRNKRSEFMETYWSRRVRSLEAYVPGEQPGDKRYLKLNTNENPYPPSPKVLDAVRNAADASLRLYPDPVCGELRETIAAHYGLKKEEVFVGNGSDEVLSFAFAAFFDGDRPVLFPDITYSFYPVYANFYGIPFRTVALAEDFSVPTEKFLVPNDGIIIPNPNAPTSRYLPLGDVERLLAYNLVIVRTLSKSMALAGMRVGFALAQAEMIEALNTVKDSFNSYTVDRLASVAAIAAFRDATYYRETSAKIGKPRDRTALALRDLGFEVLDSSSNFLFISHEKVPAAELFRKLKERAVLVRYFKKPRIDNHLRVSVGTDEDMERFVGAVKAILEE